MASKLDTKSKIILTLIGLSGLFVFVHGAIGAFSNFFLPEALMSVLYLLCYVWMFLYIFNDGMKSKVFFRGSILTLALIVMLKGILFPMGASSPVMDVVMMALALVALLCLLVFDGRWRVEEEARAALLVLIAAEVISAGLLTWQILEFGDLEMAPEHAICGSWVRPVIAVGIYACYARRMHIKARRPAEKEDAGQATTTR